VIYQTEEDQKAKRYPSSELEQESDVFSLFFFFSLMAVK